MTELLINSTKEEITNLLTNVNDFELLDFIKKLLAQEQGK